MFAALALALASCAKKGPPSGGPPDIEPPRLVSSYPDSGSARVPRDTTVSLTFSEGMEPRSTGESVAIAPRIEFAKQHWRGRTLTLELAHPLEPDHTYTLFVGGQARDRHGNPFGAGATVVFSTASVFPPGVIEGKVEARGFEAGGTSLWCYDIARGHAPDSTARDFDALGIADRNGAFQVSGLTVPGRYRLWAFADLDGNRSYEPERDILFPVDTTFALEAARPRAQDLLLRVVNPRAPGKVQGAVLDTLGIEEGAVRVIAVADTDSTRRVVEDVQTQGGFQLELAPGAWTLRAFRDLDKNRAWKQGEEPASDPLLIRVEPADDIREVVLVLRRPRGVP
jgi:hypothetical protein